MIISKVNRRMIVPLICSIAVFILLVIFFKMNTTNSVAAKPYAIRSAKITTSATSETVTLPVTIRSLPAGSPVTVDFDVPNVSGKSIYFSSVYSPLSIYADGHLIYQGGQTGSYPAFFSDPASFADSCLIPNSSSTEPIHITMIYYFPNSRNAALISEPYIGTSRSIIQMLMSEYGSHYIISLVDMIIGTIMIFISIFTYSSDTIRDRSLLWLGIFTALTGTWCISSNYLTLYISQKSSLLYMINYMTFFSIPIPIIAFTSEIMNIKKHRIIKVMMLVDVLFIICAFVLQMSGVLPFSVSMYPFHILALFTIIALTIIAISYSVNSTNAHGRLMHVPYTVFLCCIIIEAADYYLQFFTQLSPAFLIGLNIFIMLSATETCFNLVELTSQSISKRELGRDLDTLRKQVFIEKKLYERLGEPISDSKYYTDLAAENDIISDIRIDDISYIPSESRSDVDNICGNIIISAIASCCQLSSDNRYLNIHLVSNGHIASISADYSIAQSTIANWKRFAHASDQYPVSEILPASIDELIRAHDGVIKYSNDDSLNSLSILLKV